MSNFLLIVAVARALSPQDFGRFSSWQIVAVVVQSLGRGALGQALVTVFSGDSDPRIRRAGDAALGCAFVLGGAVGLAGLLLALVADLPTYAVVLLVATPAVLAQDVIRFVAFARGRPLVALASDVSWLVVQLALVFIAVGTGDAATRATLGWAAGALTGLLVGALALRQRPSLGDSTRAWLRATGATSARMLGANAMVELNRLLPAAAILVLLGAGDLAALRGAQTLLGPAFTGAQGLMLALVPGAVRAQRAGRSLDGLVSASSVACLAMSSAIAVAWMLLPNSAGRAILGDTWPFAHDVMLLVGVTWGLQLAVLGPQIGLIALNKLNDLLYGRAVMVTSVLTGTVVGGLTGSLEVALMLSALASLLTALFWWRRWRRARSESGTEGAGV